MRRECIYQRLNGDIRMFKPAVNGDFAAEHVSTEHHALRAKLIKPLGKLLRTLCGYAANNSIGSAGRKHIVQCGIGFHTTAPLYPCAVNSGKLLKHMQICRSRLLCTLKVNNMYAFHSGIKIAFNHINRRRLINRLFAVITLHKAHAFAVNNVYGGYNLNHSFKKLEIMRSPTSPLFSG